MAQNLSYIERELSRVEKAAHQTTEQMRLLEQAMANVIVQASKGSGAAGLSTVGAGVRNVAGRQLANPYMNPAGSPVGGRAIVGSEVDRDKMKGIAKEYQRHKDSLVSLTTQIDLLQKAEVANAEAVAAKTQAAHRVAASDIVNAELATQGAAATQAAKDAETKSTLTLKQRVDAYNAEIKATKELTTAEKKATQKLGELTVGVTKRATELAARTPGAGKGKTTARVYSQADLENIFGRSPGTAGKISEVAERSDFKASDIKKVTEYANSYTQLQYAAQGANGVMRKLVLTTDKAGNVFTSTQKQFRTFFSAIRRNVTEMIKWSAATLVVWGAIRKLGELLEIAIENETKLASIAVILGEEHTNLTDVFNAAAEAAAATGEAIDGVLEGYVQAYRATGNIADQTERARQAQVLLIDALTLSKLSTMTTAQAMDTLTGALRQAGLGFEEGHVLLDKWVAVSRKANVSIETLAESFAITATSASNAGLTWDELNGIIATLAESTTLSATESGNAIRAFIGGFSTDLAIKELSKFGIAVVDSMGETRGFLDVMQEISAMFEKGIISEGELNKIARAIGGRGARRGAQVATTIKNLGRAQEVAEESAKAHGDAQKALNIQLDTVQTAITKLSNSFQKLARSMGSEGGVLDVAGGVLAIFTKLVDATSALVKNLGDMTPILAAIGVLFAVTSSQSRGLLATNIAVGVGGFLNRGFGGAGGIGRMSVEEQRLQAGTAGGWVGSGQAQGFGTRTQNRLLGPGFGRNAGTLLGQGLAGGFTAFSAIRDLQQGNQAGAAGSIVGGIVGGLLTAGSPIGIIIGTAAGEAFANATINYKTEFSNFFKDIFDEALPSELTGGAPDSEEAATKALFTKVGLGSEAFGKFITKWAAVGGNIGYQGGAVIGNVTGGLGIGSYQYKAAQRGAEITPEQIALYAGRGTPEADAIREIDRKMNALRGFEAERKPGEYQYALIDEQEKLLKENIELLTKLEAVEAEVVRAAALTGDMTDKELKDALDIIPNLQSILTMYEVAFGDALRDVDSEITNVAESFDFWSNLVIYGTAAQRGELNALASDIGAVQNAIEEAKRQGDTMVTLGFDIEGTEEDERRRVSFGAAEEEERQLQEKAALIAVSQTRAITRERIVLPTVLDLDLEEADLPLLIAEMEKIRDQTFEGWWAEGLATDFSAAQIAETFAPFFLSLGKEGAGKYLEGFDQAFATKAFEDLVKRGEIVPTKEDEKLGLQQFDIASGEFPAVMAEYQSLVQSIQGQLSAQGVEWSPNEESFAALFTDYIAMPITADLTLLNIAMQELIDVSKDQLDGIYNLPTDASFYVPFSGYGLGFVNQGGGGAGGDLAGYMQGILDEEERPRRGRPEGYVPSDIRGRVSVDRLVEKTVKEVTTDLLEPSRVGGGGFAGHREAQRPMEPLMAIQLPSITDMLLAWMGIPKDAVEMGKAFFGQKEAIDPLGIPTGVGTQAVGGLLGELRDLLGSLFGANGEEPTITTKLQIESTTTTIVQLDGQVIANAIKPYLLNDEIRYEGTAGAAVKRFVI